MKMYNDSVVRKTAMKKFKAQGMRNLIVCLAIALTTFMTYTVFSIGLSYQASMKKQEERTNGTVADAILPNPTSEGIALLEESGLCDFVGIMGRVGLGGAAWNKQYGFTATILQCADRICFEEQTEPALSGVTGSYPQEENEIMLPLWAAEKLGIDSNATGQEITLSFYYGGSSTEYSRLSDDMEKQFIVSGFYDDYTANYIKNYALVYVSEKFWEAAPYAREQFDTAAYITMKENEKLTGLRDLLQEGGEDPEGLVPLHSTGESGFNVVGTVAAVLLVILVCGILIIYNVFYISASQDIAFLGQLKTLGMTKRQLKKYMRYQIRLLCLIGIPAGLLPAVFVSGFLVPLAVNAADNRLDSAVVVHLPIIPVIAVALSLLAVLIGSFKPLNVVGSVSPVSAMRYVGVDVKQKERKGKSGSVASMAWRNVFRRKKNAVIVFLSLFIAILIFFLIDGMLSGLTASALVDESMKYDIVVRDDSGQKIITAENLEQIAGISGVEQVEVKRTISDDSWEGLSWFECADQSFLTYYQDMLNSLPEDQRKFAKGFRQGDKFAMNIIGIGEWEFRRLAKEYGFEADYSALQNGSMGIWSLSGYEEYKDSVGGGSLKLYPLGLDGQGISVEKIEIVSDDEFADYTHLVAPNLILSNDVLLDLSNTCVAEVDILTAGEDDARIFREVKDIFKGTQGLIMQSKQEKVERMGRSFSTTRILGAAVSMILFAIGIMNFINTVYAGVLARKKELAVMECIGMSKKQVKKMLAAEGFVYVLVIGALMITLGSAIYLTVFGAFSQIATYAKLQFPVRAAVVTAAVLLAMAVLAPLLSYRSVTEDSAIEQLRKIE